ncbi:MAG: methylated-DNA--[protein]-cysteine S-methyltransferase [Candidatus Neomarinimicrobiota bacterium]
MKDVLYINTPIGNLEIHTNANFLYHIKFRKTKSPIKNAQKTSLIEKQIRKEIKQYFNGTRKKFTIPLKLDLPPFYKKVLLEVKKIEYGDTASYLEIARKAGNSKAVRAAGTANAKNPIPIIIPCHRIISSNNSLGKYSAGIEKKASLLKHEGINIFS